MSNINDSIFDEVETTDEGHNEGKVIKAMLMSIVASKEIQKEESENIKELKANLKNNHGMDGKDTDIIVKILMNPEKQTAFDDHYAKVLDVLNKLKNS